MFSMPVKASSGTLYFFCVSFLWATLFGWRLWYLHPKWLWTFPRHMISYILKNHFRTDTHRSCYFYKRINLILLYKGLLVKPLLPSKINTNLSFFKNFKLFCIVLWDLMHKYIHPDTLVKRLNLSISLNIFISSFIFPIFSLSVTISVFIFSSRASIFSEFRIIKYKRSP